MIAEDVGVIALGGGDALAFLQLLDGRNQVAISCGAFVFLRRGCLLHALVQRAAQIGGTAFQKQLHVAHRFLIGLGSGEIFHARAQAALDVELQAGTRMKAREIDLARGNQKIAVDEIDDAIREVGGEVRAVVGAAVFAQAARDVDARPALAQRELHVRISLVVAQQDVEARLALLDEIVFERQRFFVVGDDDVVNVDGFAHQCAGLRVLPAAFVEVAGDAAAQVLRLAHIDDFAFGVFVEIHAGLGGDGADFSEEIHFRSRLLFYVLSRVCLHAG